MMIVDMMMVKLSGLTLLRNNLSLLKRSLRIHQLLDLFLHQFLPSIELLKNEYRNPLLLSIRVLFLSSCLVESARVKRIASSDEEEAFIPKDSEESDDSIPMDVESEDEPISGHYIRFY